MDDIQRTLTSTAYALFALEQPLPLAEIAEGARTGTFPAAELHTPDWFAAAVDSQDLLAMAPELRAMPEESGQAVDLDLIGVYAPEMATRPQAPEPEPAAPERPTPEHASPEETRSIRIGLLKELGDLDS